METGSRCTVVAFVLHYVAKGLACENLEEMIRAALQEPTGGNG
jgi:hypothetical protein